MKALKQITVVFMIVLVLAVSMPLSAFADPVSASIAANAFAQAITAYGAANGVSITYNNVDSNNTNQIGEGIHDLWEQYRESESTSDDFNDVAADFVATNAFVKSNQYIAGQWLDVVGINISEDIMPAIDGFWNWLLSGPAEMVKVDNAYQWNVVNGNVNPINVLAAVPVTLLPTVTTLNKANILANGINVGRVINRNNSNNNFDAYFASNNNSTYLFLYTSGSSTYFYAISANPGTVGKYENYYNNPSYQYGLTTYNLSSGAQGVPSGYYGYTQNVGTTSNFTSTNKVDVYSSQSAGIQAYITYIDSPETYSSISVQPYIGDAVAKNPSFPDTNDDEYVPDAIGIPTNIPWDNSKYGDGTGVLTGTQIGTVVGDIDNSIVDNPAKTMELADTATPPTPEPPASEVYIPLLPVTLPHFEFNLSGIWHYVTEWVASIGAWMSMMFNVWSNLPFAMVLPVYATAVIVIVLGVYKRFFM